MLTPWVNWRAQETIRSPYRARQLLLSPGMKPLLVLQQDSEGIEMRKKEKFSMVFLAVHFHTVRQFNDACLITLENVLRLVTQGKA